MVVARGDTVVADPPRSRAKPFNDAYEAPNLLILTRYLFGVRILTHTLVLWQVDVLAGMSTYAKKAVADYNRSKGVPMEEKTKEDDHVVVVSSTPYKGATSKLATSTDGMVNIQGTYYDQDAMDSLNSSSHASHVTNSVTSVTDSETKESPHRFNDGGEAMCVNGSYFEVQALEEDVSDNSIESDNASTASASTEQTHPSPANANGTRKLSPS